MRALVTGSAGFVGRHMVRALQDVGYHVWECDTKHPQLKYRADCRTIFNDYTLPRFDVVVHAAAHVGGRVDIDGKPTFIGAYNLQLDGAFFEWAIKTEPKHAVYISSSAAYPAALQRSVNQIPNGLFESYIDLGQPQLPDATYGWTKLTGERLAEEARQEGLNVHVVRPFSGYGTDQGNDYPFNAILERVLRRDDPVVVWGDGSQVRDWVHIDDVVAAILATIDQNITEPINVCTGRATPFGELVGFMAKAADVNYSPKINYLTNAPTGVNYRVGSPKRMLKYFTPTISIEEGIVRAIRELA